MCRGRKTTKMKRSMKETMKSESSLRTEETLRKETDTNWENWARGSKSASGTVWEREDQKNTADSGGIQRHQKYVMHKIWKKENAHPESEKWQWRDNHIKEKKCQCLWWILQQALCWRSTRRRSARPSQLGNKKEHRKRESRVDDVKNEIPEFTQDEVQTAIDSLKKEMIRQIFNEVTKQEDCTPETWKIMRIRLICKKGHVEDVGNTARCALCQRFEYYTQQSYTTDFTTGLAVRNQRTREGFDVHTKRRIILQHTDRLNRNDGSGVSKCGSRQWTSWRHVTQ